MDISLSHKERTQEEALLKFWLHIVVAHLESEVFLASIKGTALLEDEVTELSQEVFPHELCHASAIAHGSLCPCRFSIGSLLFLNILRALHSK